MGKPKKRTTPRRSGNRRSHLASKLARRVNATSPVKVVSNPKKLEKKPEPTKQTAE